MISLKPLGIKAQSSLEFLVSAIAVILVMFMGTSVLLHGFATLMCARLASSHSRCLVTETNPLICESKTRNALKTYFGFKNIVIQTKKIRQIVRTEINAQQFSGLVIRASYDLEPSEYKRVSHGK
ncbi:MAG: hypothetical protein SGI74_01215 [Oligoflexia bacterium]|nr:hypothetical protein [Oligoflexia bacterium]